MIGLIVIAALILLIYLINLIAKIFAAIFSGDDNPRRKKYLHRGMVTFCVFALVGDEILGGTQLAYFCLSEPEVQVLVDDLDGRTVQSTTAFHFEESAILKVKKGVTKFIDVNSQEIVATGYMYKSQGGWLSRTIAFNGAKHPYLFAATCSNTKALYQLPPSNNMILQR